MITFGKAHAIGNNSELKTDMSVISDGKEIGRIYFLPLSFNQGFSYNVIIDKHDKGFFASMEDAKNFCLTGLPAGKEYW